MVVKLLELEGAAREHDDEAEQRSERQALEHDLHGDGGDDRAERDPVPETEADLLVGLRHAHDGLVEIGAGTAGEVEDGEHETDNHREAGDPGHRRHVRHRHVHAVLRHGLRDDALEDEAEANGQRHVRSRKAEAESTGDRAAVKLHLVHELEQRRNQKRNEGDVHGHHVLRKAGDERQAKAEDERPAAHLGADPAHEHLHEARVRDRHGESAQKDVGERGRRVGAEAAREQLHRLREAEPARETRDQRGRNQSEKNIDARKAERAEHDDRYDDRIEDEFHGWTSFSILSSVRIPLPADALGGRWRPFAGHTRSIMTQPATIPHIPKDVFS